METAAKKTNSGCARGSSLKRGGDIQADEPMGHQEAVVETAEASSRLGNSHGGCWRRVVSAESCYCQPPLESQICSLLTSLLPSTSDLEWQHRGKRKSVWKVRDHLRVNETLESWFKESPATFTD